MTVMKLGETLYFPQPQPLNIDLQLVASLNNMGVSYLDSGDLGMALNLLRYALKCCLRGVDVGIASQIFQVTDDPASIDPPILSPGKGTGSVAVSPSTSGTTTPASRMTTKSPDEPTALLFVHEKGIHVIPASYAAYSPYSIVNGTIVSCVLIFNLGLVYHLLALRENRHSAERFSRAQQLYEKSQILLTSVGVRGVATGNAEIDMLSLALLNNLAHVCFERSQFDVSNAYYVYLIQFALSVRPADYNNMYIRDFVDRQKSNVLLNAIILRAPIAAASA